MNAPAYRDQDTGLMKGKQSPANTSSWAFSNSTEVLCSPSEHGFCSEDKAMLVQHADGPRYVVIGSRVADEQLAKLAERVDTSIHDLLAYRNSRAGSN